MGRPLTRTPSLSRRAFLGSVIGGAAVRTLPTAAAAPPAAEPTVMSRNLYLGVDLFRLFGARSMADVRRITGSLFEEAKAHPYRARAEAIAAEIEATGADVVAVQEAALVRTQRPGDFGAADDAPASSVVVDVLEHLTSALEARDLAYDVAASTVTTDIELPADVDGERIDVRLTDRDAVLTRSTVETEAPETGTYDARFSFPMGERTFTASRGYASVTATVGDATFTAVSTHLESVSGDVRTRQAEELLSLLPADRPVILAGDFNSGPGTSTGAYDVLTASFEDAYAVRNPDGDGYTCCHASDLRNEQPSLSRRIDAVLYRGGVRPTTASRVGHEADDRLSVEVNGETERIWPSDHAGVVATFETAPIETAETASVETATTESTAVSASPSTTRTGTTSTSTARTGTTSTATARTGTTSSATAQTGTTSSAGENDTAPTTGRDDSLTEVRVPGFGFAAAAAGIVGGALAYRRRRE